MPIFLTSVATKPRSPTFPGSHANLSHICGKLNQGHLPFRVLMPILLSPTVTSRHDARLSSTTHCALRASRINYNLTNLSRCYSFLFFYYGPMQHPAVQPISFYYSFKCFLVILQALSLSLPKSPSFLHKNCKSHMQRLSCASTHFSHAYHYCQEPYLSSTSGKSITQQWVTAIST